MTALFLILGTAKQSFGAGHEEAKKKTTLYEFWDDTKSTFLSLTNIEKDDLLPLLSFSALTTTVIFFDDSIRGALGNKSSGDHSKGRKFLKYFEYLGNGGYMVPGYAATYLLGSVSGNKKLRDTGLMTLESLLVSGTITLSLKHLTSRSRPGRNEGAFSFSGPGYSGSKNSFPSGHTTIAFQTAAVIASQYRSPIVQTTSYLLATLVAAQRVMHDFHWTSDVLAGAAIGILVGNTVVRLHKSKKRRISFTPVLSYDSRYAGLRVIYSF